MARQLDLFSGIGDLGSVYFKDRYVTIEKIPDISVSTVRRKSDTLSEAADVYLAYLCHLLAIDLECHRRTGFAREPCLLVGIPGYQNGERQVALWANSEALRRIAHDDVIDDARRVLLQVDDADRINIAIGGTRSSVVGHDRDLAARYDIDIIRKDTSWHIVLLVDDLSAIDSKERHLVHNWFDGQRLGAVG